MARYHVEYRHSDEDCREAIDHLWQEGSALANRFDCGCPSGVHTCWTTVEAGSESAVRDQLPPLLRDHVGIIEVSKLVGLDQDIDSLQQGI